MKHLLKRLYEEGKVELDPRHRDVLFPLYLTQMGSVTYGASTNSSDVDLYGVFAPQLESLFPHLSGVVQGFNHKKHEDKRFEYWQRHHVADGAMEYDFAMYGLNKYLYLCAEGNPNLLDSLYTDDKFVFHVEPAGQLLREKRQMFVTKRAARKAVGFARQELGRLAKSGKSGRSGNRPELVAKFGFDTKAAYHVVRLLGQAEYMLTNHTLKLDMQGAHLQDVRAGKYSFAELSATLNAKFEEVEVTLNRSTLREVVDMEAVEKLMVRLLDLTYSWHPLQR
jgi:predicted nucleotidyltransferase